MNRPLFESPLTDVALEIVALRAKIREMEAHVTQLKGEVDAEMSRSTMLPRGHARPCAHAPTWGVADCAWCQVRERLRTDLGRWVSTGHAAEALRAFDAAVQAGREGQG